ncbi:hypothetical protein FRC08_008119 [Ceratobasidium sp. 394]|nr:hypothetical protein FRC08_008119 [Ceratobasidium sp. 394]
MSRPQHYGSPTNFSPLERSATAESEEEAATMSTGSRPLSRNAQAQARLRARRKAYVESLEANVKRLQALVDALSVAPNRESHPLLDPSSLRTQLLSSSSSTPSISLSSPPQDVHGASTPQPTEDQCVRQLQLENGRLRRERDALRVQLDALVAYISRGGASSTEPSSNSGISSLSSYTAPTTQEVSFCLFPIRTDLWFKFHHVGIGSLHKIPSSHSIGPESLHTICPRPSVCGQRTIAFAPPQCSRPRRSSSIPQLTRCITAVFGLFSHAHLSLHEHCARDFYRPRRNGIEKPYGRISSLAARR